MPYPWEIELGISVYISEGRGCCAKIFNFQLFQLFPKINPKLIQLKKHFRFVQLDMARSFKKHLNSDETILRNIFLTINSF